MGRERIEQLDRALKASVEFAYVQPDKVRGYIREHAQEMDEAVMRAHIEMYVNEYTFDYGGVGVAAIEDLLGRAEEAGVVPKGKEPLFIDG